MRRLVILALSLVLVFALAAPAFAVNGSGGAGRDFGEHHASHAIDMGGFTADENPGFHRGYSGWTHE